MIFLGLGVLIGGPGTAWIVWGLTRPEKPNGQPDRRQVQLSGFFQWLGWMAGTVCGYGFFLGLIGVVIWALVRAGSWSGG